MEDDTELEQVITFITRDDYIIERYFTNKQGLKDRCIPIHILSKKKEPCP